MSHGHEHHHRSAAGRSTAVGPRRRFRIRVQRRVSADRSEVSRPEHLLKHHDELKREEEEKRRKRHELTNRAATLMTKHWFPNANREFPLPEFEVLTDFITEVRGQLGDFVDTENTVGEVRRMSWPAQDEIVYLQDLLKMPGINEYSLSLPGSGWGCSIDSVLELCQSRNELRGQQLQQREELMRRPEWYASPAEVQKLNDLIKWRAETYTAHESSKPSAVAEHEKQQEEMRREAQQEQPNRR